LEGKTAKKFHAVCLTAAPHYDYPAPQGAAPESLHEEKAMNCVIPAFAGMTGLMDYLE